MNFFLRWISFWVWVILTFLFFWLTYWVWTNLNVQSDWDIISKDIWNNLVEKINQNWNDIDLLKSNISNISIPKWWVMAFYWSTCPSWWDLADWSWNETKTDGSLWTLDLRWEFIRWLDDWRGIDSWRVLWSRQISTQLIVDNDENETVWAVDWASNNLVNLWYEPTQSPVWTTVKLHYVATTMKSPQNSSFLRSLRPNNVALLYCVKN